MKMPETAKIVAFAVTDVLKLSSNTKQKAAIPSANKYLFTRNTKNTTRVIKETRVKASGEMIIHGSQRAK